MRQSTRAGRRRHRWVALGFVLGVVLRGGAAWASPVPPRHHAPHVSEHALDALEGFLRGGVRVWATVKPPKIPAGLSITTPDGQLKQNLLVDYLVWKRDRHPAFFDRRHPRIAPLLARAETIAPQAFVPPAPRPRVPSTLAAESRRGSSAAPLRVSAEILAAPVPEPSSAALLLTVVGAAAWRTRGSAGGRTRGSEA